MSHTALVPEQRRHPRAQLRLPVRLRWLGPFSSHFEICQTLDVSRSGLLISRPEASQDQSRVWVTFPFEIDAPGPQPETPARVVRAKTTANGNQLVALELEPLTHPLASSFEGERRKDPRVPLAVPISVRAAGVPWAEEAMTLDVSSSGVRFETSRLYNEGDKLRVRLNLNGWTRRGEFSALVVRVEQLPDIVEQQVALECGAIPARPRGV